MVGNACTNWDFDSFQALIETVVGFDMAEQELLHTWNENECSQYDYNIKPFTPKKVCADVYYTIQKLIFRENIYDLYRGQIHDSFDKTLNDINAPPQMGESMVGGERKTYRRSVPVADKLKWAKHFQHLGAPVANGTVLTDYMNRADVREAFNIPEGVQAWEECSYALDYHEQQEASIWIYHVLKNQMRIVFYSGDTDGAVPTAGSRMWLDDLGWERTEGYQPWYSNGQVAGYYDQYDGLDFVTVKGVGHMAPQWAR